MCSMSYHMHGMFRMPARTDGRGRAHHSWQGSLGRRRGRGVAGAGRALLWARAQSAPSERRPGQRPGCQTPVHQFTGSPLIETSLAYQQTGKRLTCRPAQDSSCPSSAQYCARTWPSVCVTQSSECTIEQLTTRAYKRRDVMQSPPCWAWPAGPGSA